MQTFDHLHIALTRYLFQTQTEVENMNHLLVIGDVDPDSRLDFLLTKDAFQRRCDAAKVALTQLEALEASALATILRQWAAGDEMLREIAHNYEKDGTLDY